MEVAARCSTVPVAAQIGSTDRPLVWRRGWSRPAGCGRTAPGADLLPDGGRWKWRPAARPSQWRLRSDQRTAPLFGDGAGAVLLAAGEPHQGLICYQMGADGSGGPLLDRPSGGSDRINGPPPCLATGLEPSCWLRANRTRG